MPFFSTSSTDSIPGSGASVNPLQFLRRSRIPDPRISDPQVSDDAPLFIFLPGMDGTGHLFEVQQQNLLTQFDICCLSIPLNDTTSWESLAHHTAALIRAERAANPQRPVYLCGESFGGCLALMVAHIAPDAFDYLILVNPASSFGDRAWRRWIADMVHLLPPHLYPLSAIALLPFLIDSSRVADEHRQFLLQIMQSVTQQSAAWRLALVGNFDLNSLPIQQIQQPTLVLASGRDRLLPSVKEADRLIQRLPDARKVILPNSGHACLLEIDINLAQILHNHNFLSPSTPCQVGAPSKVAR